MNIGIFTDTYTPKINGVVTSILTLENELTKLGHNVYIFTTTQSKELKKDKHVYRIPSMPLVLFADHKVGLGYSHKSLKAAKKLKLDIIHSQTEFSLGLFAKLVSRKCNIPIVHTYHTMYEDYMHYVSKFNLFHIPQGFARKYSKIFCNGIDRLIAPTEKTHDFLRSYGIRRPISIIPSGIDFEPFNKSQFKENEIISLKSKYGIKQGEPVVMFIGRVAKEKSIDVAISSMPDLLSKMPNAKLLIVGDGPFRYELQELANSLSISNSVIFTGAQPWSDIGKFYQMGDVFVSASVTETQGLTFTEAMASGLPVVAKEDDNLKEIISDGVNGRIFQDDKELSGILYELLTNKEQRNTLVSNAYTTLEQFSSSTFGHRIETLYKEVISTYDRD